MPLSGLLQPMTEGQPIENIKELLPISFSRVMRKAGVAFSYSDSIPLLKLTFNLLLNFLSRLKKNLSLNIKGSIA